MGIDTVTSPAPPTPPLSSPHLTHKPLVVSYQRLPQRIPGEEGAGLSERHHGSLMGVNWRGAGSYVSLTHVIPLCVMCGNGRVGGGGGGCVNPALDKQAVLWVTETHEKA